MITHIICSIKCDNVRLSNLETKHAKLVKVIIVIIILG